MGCCPSQYSGRVVRINVIEATSIAIEYSQTSHRPFGEEKQSSSRLSAPGRSNSVVIKSRSKTLN